MKDIRTPPMVVIPDIPVNGHFITITIQGEGAKRENVEATCLSIMEHVKLLEQGKRSVSRLHDKYAHLK